MTPVNKETIKTLERVIDEEEKAMGTSKESKRKLYLLRKAIRDLKRLYESSDCIHIGDIPER